MAKDKITWDEFMFHYGCEWDTGDFLGWEEVRICMEQLGMIKSEPRELTTIPDELL